MPKLVLVSIDYGILYSAAFDICNNKCNAGAESIYLKYDSEHCCYLNWYHTSFSWTPKWVAVGMLPKVVLLSTDYDK